MPNSQAYQRKLQAQRKWHVPKECRNFQRPLGDKSGWNVPKPIMTFMDRLLYPKTLHRGIETVKNLKESDL